MSFKFITSTSLVALVFFSACAPRPAPLTISVDPVYDKFGGVIGCVGPDGVTRPVPTSIPGTSATPPRDRASPCDPISECEDPVYNRATGEWTCRPPEEDCDIGFFDAAGNWVCREADTGGSDPRTPGTSRDPGRDPTGRDPS